MSVFFKLFLALAIIQVGFFPLMEAKASVFIITNLDDKGKGFNDTASFIPTGGNNATTLGQARLIAFQYAADKIANLLSGNHVITIEASMDSLGGTSTQATLGGAGAVAYVYDFNHAPEPDLLYPIALANKFFGQDIDPFRADIRARFNCDIDRDDILTGSQWYYGLDEQAEPQDIDFVTVVMHELMHGLGFSSTINLTTGSKAAGKDDVYSRHLYHMGITPPTYPDMSDQQRFLANTSTNHLYWNGRHVNDHAQQRLIAGFNNNRVEMFAPTEVVEHSSLSHFSSSLEPNEIMEPFYTVADHDLGLAKSVLSDIGWGDEADLAITVTPQTVDVLSFTNQYTITIHNNGPDIAHDVYVTSNLLDGEVIYQEDASLSINCEQNGQGILCKLGDMDNGAALSYTLTTVRNTLNNHQLNTSILADIIDVIPENNQNKTVIEGVSNRPAIVSDMGVGGGGMVNIFLMMVVLLIVFIFRPRRILLTKT